MRRLRMLEEQKAWKREAVFNRIEVIAQMDAQRLHVGFGSGPLYSKLYNPRWPHTPAEYTLVMNVDVETEDFFFFRSPRGRRNVIHRHDDRPR